MKKYKVNIAWYAQIRGYDEIEIEAENKEQAEELYFDKLEIDYNSWCKVIDSDHEVISIEEIEE